MESLRVRVLEASEPQLVKLAMAVAGRVVGRELQTDPTLVASWAREAVELFVTREGLVVSVAPDLASLVPADAWANALATPHTLVVDPSRAPGSGSPTPGEGSGPWPGGEPEGWSGARVEYAPAHVVSTRPHRRGATCAPAHAVTTRPHRRGATCAPADVVSRGASSDARGVPEN